MHILAIIVAVVLVGAGAYFFTSNSGVQDTQETVQEDVQVDNVMDDAVPTESETGDNMSEDGESPSGDNGMMPDSMDDAMEEMHNGDNNQGMMMDQDQSIYTDGVYTKDGAYVSPAGDESVTITLTLEDGVVVDADFIGNATHPGSITNQGKFAAGYESEVVGKSLDEISLDVVNGSSLTPKGFMDAVEAIKTEAQG